MKIFYRFLCWYDGYWRRKHNVERFDDLLSFSFEKYSGECQIMDDETWIEPGDCLAIIHFNRECFTNASNDPKQNARNALRFRRMILSSFKQLAKDIDQNEKFSNVKAFHGISWLPPHGEKLGFVIEKLPDSIPNFIRKFYITVLLKTFFPHIAMQGTHRVELHAYWLTRQALLENFSMDRSVTARSINEAEIRQQPNVDVVGAY
jgi:hypothetical protein